jgi:hypothetical protein
MDSSKKARAKAIEDQINRQLEAFAGQSGIEPGPDCPVFIDLDGDTAIPFTEKNFRQRLVEAAIKSGTDPTSLLLQFGFEVSEGKA